MTATRRVQRTLRTATSKTKRRRSSITGADAQKWLDALKTAPAVLTEETLQAIESAHREDNFGAERRAALFSLQMEGAALIDKIEHADHKTAVAFAGVCEKQRQYLQALRALVELIESANIRISTALCYRVDFEAIHREAVAEVERNESRVVVEGART